MPRKLGLPRPQHLLQGWRLNGALPGSEALLAVLGITDETLTRDAALEEEFLHTGPSGVSENVRSWETNSLFWVLRHIWGRTREIPKETLEADSLNG